MNPRPADEGEAPEPKKEQSWFRSPPIAAALIGGCFLVLTTFINIYLTCPRAIPKETLDLQEEIDKAQDSADNLKKQYDLLNEDLVADSKEVIGVRRQARYLISTFEAFGGNLEESDKLGISCKLGMLYVIKAELGSKKSRVLDDTRSAIKRLDSCLEGISRIEEVWKNSDKKDLYHKALFEWVLEWKVREWAHYHRAVAEALLIRNGTKQEHQWREIGDFIDKIDDVFLDEYPIYNNPTLAWVCQNIPGADTEVCNGDTTQNAP